MAKEETTTETSESEVKPLYDLDELGVPEGKKPEEKKDEKPAAKKEEKSEPEEEEENESEEESEEEKDEEEESEEGQEKESESEVNEEEEEEEEEESEASKSKEKPADKKETKVSDDDFVKNLLSEEYEIHTKEELIETLQGVDQLLQAYEELKNKSTEPVFANEGQKKAYEFLTKTGYDPARFNEGVLTHAKLISMDLDQADAKSILEQAFILRHPDLTVEEARYKFDKNYSRKFVIDKSKFEEEADYTEAKKEADIDLKSEVAKDREFLKKQQETYKAAPEKDKPEEPIVAPEVEVGIKKTVAAFNEFLDGGKGTPPFTTIVVEDENPDKTFNYKVPQKYLKQIRAAGNKYLSQPGIYNEKGIIPEHESEGYTVKLAMALAGEEILIAALKHANRIADIATADGIAKVKPTGKGGKAKADMDDADPMKQFEIQARQKVRARGNR